MKKEEAEKSKDTNEADNSSTHYHIPVLFKETIEGLNIKRDGVYVDCTFGGGGHSREILKRLGEKGRLIVFDQDEDAKRNVPVDERIIFVAQNFRHLQRFLRLHKIKEVDGILADLGVSSHQFDEAERGFSIRFDAPLDMRMDNRQTITAAQILNTYEEARLHKLFEKFGEVTNAKTLAKTIVTQRLITPFKMISAFKQSLQGIVKGNPNKYFAQVFQALRIEVNEEMKVLEEMLEQAIAVLAPGGRLAVISFHSLEDRIAKNFFKYGMAEEPDADDVFGTRPESPLKLITKKPVTASREELKINPRSRSAKLRVAEKK
ncbi:MAG: 16S rRNA (cytosine(1402)-N(4))-methyltransferase RsmH [Chitinophagaceae bacterium]|nr:MAG: 16S rRNA (cytosine(1402)-N(4))-methyltransferase RsmH [Chitinophagaceae bacterium]